MRRLYSFGQYTYKLQRDGGWRVFRWDPLSVSWLFVDSAGSKREGRRVAAADAYAKGINP